MIYCFITLILITKQKLQARDLYNYSSLGKFAAGNFHLKFHAKRQLLSFPSSLTMTVINSGD